MHGTLLGGPVALGGDLGGRSLQFDAQLREFARESLAGLDSLGVALLASGELLGQLVIPRAGCVALLKSVLHAPAGLAGAALPALFELLFALASDALYLLDLAGQGCVLAAGLLQACLEGSALTGQLHVPFGGLGQVLVEGLAALLGLPQALAGLGRLGADAPGQVALVLEFGAQALKVAFEAGALGGAFALATAQGLEFAIAVAELQAGILEGVGEGGQFGDPGRQALDLLIALGEGRVPPRAQSLELRHAR